MLQRQVAEEARGRNQAPMNDTMDISMSVVKGTAELFQDKALLRALATVAGDPNARGSNQRRWRDEPLRGGWWLQNGTTKCSRSHRPPVGDGWELEYWGTPGWVILHWTDPHENVQIVRRK